MVDKFLEGLFQLAGARLLKDAFNGGHELFNRAACLALETLRLNSTTFNPALFTRSKVSGGHPWINSAPSSTGYSGVW